MIATVADQSQEVAELCRRFNARRLFLFGSALEGLEGARDVDFVVEFGPRKMGEYGKTYFGLKWALEELFGKPVDLVEADAIRNPYLRASIEKTKVPVYDAA